MVSEIIGERMNNGLRFGLCLMGSCFQCLGIKTWINPLALRRKRLVSPTRNVCNELQQWRATAQGYCLQSCPGKQYLRKETNFTINWQFV